MVVAVIGEAVAGAAGADWRIATAMPAVSGLAAALVILVGNQPGDVGPSSAGLFAFLTGLALALPAARSERAFTRRQSGSLPSSALTSTADRPAAVSVLTVPANEAPEIADCSFVAAAGTSSWLPLSAGGDAKREWGTAAIGGRRRARWLMEGKQ